MKKLQKSLSNVNCTIVIVSYNTRDIIDLCLTKAEKAASFSQKTLGNQTNIIVVDNASTDGTVAMIRKKHPNVTLMALKRNIRFAKGNNVGLKKAKTPYILILNSDVFLEKDTLVRLIKHMENNPTYAALCCQLLFQDRSFQTVGGYIPTPLRTILWSLGIESLPIVKQFIKPIYNHNKHFYKKERAIEWCSGAFMLMREKVYQKIGGFDEKIFFYMEDVELCKRILDAGFKIYFTPTISVIHLAGESSKRVKTYKKINHTISGMLYYINKFYPDYFNLVKYTIQLGIKIRWYFYLLIGQQENALQYKKTLCYLEER